jgi:YcxB-like protein
MRCEYVFTYDDFRESMKLYRKASKKAAVAYWLWVWILPIVLLAVGILSLPEYMKSSGGVLNGFFWPVCLGLGAAWGLPVRYRMALRRAFKLRNTLAKDKPMFFDFDETTVRFIVPGGTEVTYSWVAFTNYLENDRVAVLFIQPEFFHTVPKRAMGEEGWSLVRSYVDTNIRKN